MAWVAVQLRRAWQFECRNARQHSKLCTEEPAAFRERLRGHVAAVREWGLDAVDIGVLAARDIYLVAGEPDALASRISMLASFFKVPPIPAVQPADALLSTNKHSGRAQLRHLVLHGLYGALYMGFADVHELMANYTRLGLFATKDAAREGCLNNIGLLRTISWRVLVRKNAAVRAVGGTAEDTMTAYNYSAERVLEAGMLREYSGCAPTLVAATSVQAAQYALGLYPNFHMGKVWTELHSWCGQH
jgi:hypothetical protein